MTRIGGASGKRCSREANCHVTESIGVTCRELKTPLTAFKASTQLALCWLNRGLRPDSADSYLHTQLLTETAEMLSYMDREIDHLSQFVTDLMDVTRTYSGNCVMAAERCDQAPIVRDIVEQQRVIWTARRIACDLDDASAVQVIADGQRIGQFVTNLLVNALKYSSAALPVTVLLEVTKHEARISVRDEVPGVPLEAQTRIWERFHQLEDIAQRGDPATDLGLGFYVSRTIFEKYRGEVGVESTPDHGSTFWYSLPLAAPPVVLDCPFGTDRRCGTDGQDTEGPTHGQHAGPAGADRRG